MFADDILAQLEGRDTGRSSDPSLQAPEGTPRIAIYDNERTAPRVVDIKESRLPDLVDALATRTYDLARQQGSRLPFTVLREVIENLIHAYFSEVVVTILDGGNTIRISDRGPGIPSKAKALRPGFTTADASLKRFLKGVGSGLPIANESLEHLEGVLQIEDNLEGGTVITLKVPRSHEPAHPQAVHPQSSSGEEPDIPQVPTRQLKVLLILVELGTAGPTRVAEELQISRSTAYRDLSALERAGLVTSRFGGARQLTERGLTYLDEAL